MFITVHNRGEQRNMNDFEHMPDVLTIPECQQVLRIGRSTAYRLIQSGELRCIRIGRSIRIPKKYVMEFVSKQSDANEAVSAMLKGAIEKS